MKINLFEPTSFVSNIILFLMTLVLGQEISDVYRQSFHPFHFHLSWSFYAVAAGSIIGALFHGFSPHFSKLTREWIWKGALTCMGFTTFFLMMAGVSAVMSYDSYRITMWVAVIGLVLYGWQTVKFAGFGHSVKFIAVGMIFIFTAFATHYWRQAHPGSGYLFAGVLLTVASGGLWATGWSIHKQFNHNDLFHVIQMVCLWLLYQGGVMTVTAQLPR